MTRWARKPKPRGMWHWSCPAGHHGTYDKPAEADRGAEDHMKECDARPVSMHTGTRDVCSPTGKRNPNATMEAPF